MAAFDQNRERGRFDDRFDGLYDRDGGAERGASPVRSGRRPSALDAMQAAGGNLATINAKDGIRGGELGAGVATSGFKGGAGSVPFLKEMEAAFQADFSQVQAYAGGAAGEACMALGAKAYAVGNQIAFRDATPTKETVAHELAHVIQQGGGGQRLVQAQGTKGGSLSSMEEEADHAAVAATQGRQAKVSGQHAKRVMCEDADLSEKQGVWGWLADFFGGKDGASNDEKEAKKANAVDLLKQKPVPVEDVLKLLRAKKPRYAADYEGEIKPQEVDRLIESKLTGDAKWRAGNIRRYGAESGWPPALRNDTFAIITKAREALLARKDVNHVADLLRPLNATAQHQVITAWRGSQGRLGEGKKKWAKGKDRDLFLDKLQVALDGPKHAPKDELGAAPLLNLESKSEAALYDYFEGVYEERGMTFETGADVRQVLNIRNYGLTTTEGAKEGLQSGKKYHARAFTIWVDGKGTKHAKSAPFGSTGVGGKKLGATETLGNDLANDAGYDDFKKDSDGKRTDQTTRSIRKNRDLSDLSRGLRFSATRLRAMSFMFEGLANMAKVFSASSANVEHTQRNAKLAMDGALSTRRSILTDKAKISRIKRLTRRKKSQDARDANILATKAGEDLTGLLKSLETTYNTARDAWILAHAQTLSNAEEGARFAWSKAVKENGEGSAEAKKAKKLWVKARRVNNKGQDKNNKGAMSETNALPWIQEGQYRTQKRRPAKNDKGNWRYGKLDFWAVNAGIDGKKSTAALAPVDRDWNADAFLDQGEKDVAGTAVGTGILIHRAVNKSETKDSIGCQTAPTRDFKKFTKTLGTKKTSNSFSFSIVDARHLAQWK